MAAEPAAERDPQAALEQRACARALLARPLLCKERDPERFQLIRRHEAALDRWFTQRLGYRLHVDADTARLWKLGAAPGGRPLRAPSGRPLHPLEYTLLALLLACTAAGSTVISLRDLVEQVRSAAVEAEVALDASPATRRALVAALRWMIEHGLAAELHAGVDAYAADATADAVLRIRPDRIALLALPALSGAASAPELLGWAERREATRQWLRCRLVEDPVLYRTDLREAEWSELRRRLGEEAKLLHEMFGLLLEARAEGVAAIDPSGTLSARPFPAGGTLGHAALLLLEALRARAGESIPWSDVLGCIEALAAAHRRHWSKDFTGAPARLAQQVLEWLVELRLAEYTHAQPCAALSGDPAPGDAASGNAGSAGSSQPEPAAASSAPQHGIRLLAAAGRFLPALSPQPGGLPARQGALW